jgi:hypothetical protein
MQQLTRDLQADGYDTSSNAFSPALLTSQAISNQTGEGTRWSGLGYGVLQDMMKDSELNNNVQVLSFPSEEIEALESSDAWKDVRPTSLARQIKRSVSGRPRGVDAAVQAVRDIQAQAAEQGKDPIFVVVSHSSGGRSAVKFAERLKDVRDPQTGRGTELDLAFTVDPVKEAHFAVLEAGKELGEEGLERGISAVTDYFFGVRFSLKEPTVRSRSQPKSLYRTGNSGEWVNFYQTKDTQGMKMSPRFGIHGSPVSGAENRRVDDVNSGGHGEIAIHPEVSQRFMAELRERVRD